METVNVAEIFEKYEGSNSFVLDVIAQFKAKGKISYKQEKSVLNTIKREAVANERKANCLEIEPGKGKIVGRVVKINAYPDRYNYGRSYVYKMLVEDVKGYRIYGSVPSAIVDEIETGMKVSLDAKLVQKEKGFGFFSYPKNAEFLSEDSFAEIAEEYETIISKAKSEADANASVVLAKQAKERKDRELMDFLASC